MIQISDWMLIAGIIVIFLLSIVYFVYFIIKSKLFPKVVAFQNEIKPNEAITISAIEGSGIIKKLEIKTNENDKSLISITVDQSSLITFSVSKKINNPSGNFDALEESLSLEINLNKKFARNFTLFFHNNSDKLSHTNGKIYYEIRKPLKTTLRTLLSELFN